MIIALNHKSNFNQEEFLNYQEEFKKIQTDHTMILCPSTIHLAQGKTSSIFLGAQNVSAYEKGAYTGEVSAEQLKSYGVSYCIVGHSERRQYQKETNEEIGIKITRLFQNGIIPILCIGESKEEREEARVKEVLQEELEMATRNLTEEERNNLIIAYEPIWSIGTGIIPTNDEIHEVFDFIKGLFPNTKVLYGGSANEQNIEELKQVKTIDGYLLGGLSLHPDKLKLFLDRLN